MDKIKAGFLSLYDLFGVGFFMIGFQDDKKLFVFLGVVLFFAGSVENGRSRIEMAFVANIQFAASYLILLIQLMSTKPYGALEIAGTSFMVVTLLKAIPYTTAALCAQQGKKSKGGAE